MVWSVPLMVWNGPYQVEHSQPTRRRFVPYGRDREAAPIPAADPDEEGNR
jgi:hypothetical protein